MKIILVSAAIAAGAIVGTGQAGALDCGDNPHSPGSHAWNAYQTRCTNSQGSNNPETGRPDPYVPNTPYVVFVDDPTGEKFPYHQHINVQRDADGNITDHGNAVVLETR